MKRATRPSLVVGGRRTCVVAALMALSWLAGCVATERGHHPTGRRNAAARVFVPAADARIDLTDGLNRVPLEGGAMRFDRVIDTPGRGFRWDSPGARMRWRTNSHVTRAHLRYSTGHTGTSRNSIGSFRVDGRADPTWIFSRPGSGNATLVVDMPVPSDGRWHDYEIILPYGDSVDLLGIEVDPDAGLRRPTPRSRVRYVAFGDSITHGFTASDVTNSYAFLVAERNEWEIVNLGIGSRGTNGVDGAMLADIEGDVVSILIGVNDWQAGVELQTFRQNYVELLKSLRSARVDRLVYVITPLWVPPTWKPSAARYPLEHYREIIRDVVATGGDPRLRLVEGPLLIDHRAELFDPIAVHPNNAGFAQMAERLAEVMR